MREQLWDAKRKRSARASLHRRAMRAIYRRTCMQPRSTDESSVMQGDLFASLHHSHEAHVRPQLAALSAARTMNSTVSKSRAKTKRLRSCEVAARAGVRPLKRSSAILPSCPALSFGRRLLSSSPRQVRRYLRTIHLHSAHERVVRSPARCECSFSFSIWQARSCLRLRAPRRRPGVS